MKNKAIYGYLAFLVLTIFLTNLVFAIPAIPHQFYGTVAINGTTAPDGTVVSATIETSTISTQVAQGKYGQDPPPPFFVTDPNGNRNGKTISFFVDGIAAGTEVFQSGTFTEKNLAITKDVSQPPPNNPAPDGGNPGSGPGGGPGGGGSQETNLFKVDKTSLKIGEELTVSAKCFENNGCVLQIDGKTATTFEKNYFNWLDYKTTFDKAGEKTLTFLRGQTTTVLGTIKVKVVDPNAVQENQNAGQSNSTTTGNETNGQSNGGQAPQQPTNPNSQTPPNASKPIIPNTPTGLFGLGIGTATGAGLLGIAIIVAIAGYTYSKNRKKQGNQQK